MEGLATQDGPTFVVDRDEAEIRSRQIKGLARAFLDGVMPAGQPHSQEYRDAMYAMARSQETPSQRDMVIYVGQCISTVQGQPDRPPAPRLVV